MKPAERAKGLDLEPGTVLGKYEVLRKLATGGMAEIYLSRVRGTAGFEKLVVLKRILPHIAQDPTFVNMFLDEARLAATLQHPNIADVYDVAGQDSDEVFFTMEYVHGQDVRGIRWAARKRDEQIPLAISLAIIHGTASALDYAHEKRATDGSLLGLVHRDISSSNVMISYDGAVKLLDFGIARATNQSQKTQTGTLKGKIPYMSPEQCRSAPLDRRSDLFSLGTVMFEMTTGRRPFRGQGDFDIMEQIVHGSAPRPSTIVKGYPEELEAITMKLLARDAADRYQSAEEMLHDLDAFLAKHQLWASTKVVGKYMRMVFADRIAAWETAQQSGEVLVAEHFTPPTGRHELMTPSSSFPAVRLSQERLALRPSDELIEGGDATVAMPNVRGRDAGRPGMAEPSYQTISPPSRRYFGIVAGGLALGALGIVVVLLLGRSGTPEAKADEPLKEPAVAKPAQKAPDKSIDQTVAKPADKPADKPAEKPVADAAAREVPAPTEPVATATKPPARPIAKGGYKPPPIKSQKLNVTSKQAMKEPKPIPTTKPDDNVDTSSPFLPPKQD